MRFASPLVLASLILAAVGAAAESGPAPGGATAWALDWGRAGNVDLASGLQGTIACPLGDVDADGADDLLLRVHTTAQSRLDALAGPDHTRVLWTSAVEATAVLRCAPDAGLDGIADPLVLLREAADSATPDGAPVGSDTVTTTLATLDGATGRTLVSIDAEESVRAGGAGGAFGANARTVALTPAATDLYVFVAQEATAASASLPLESLALSTTEADVRIELLDATGAVQGAIETTAGAEILAHAVVVDEVGTRVVVLSTTEAVPLDQAPAQVPTVSAHAVDGTLQWSVELAATANALLIVPRAGDLDADGVQDIIVETMPMGLEMAGGATLDVLSGASGEVLLHREAASGLLAALPFGDLDAGATAAATAEAKARVDALLVITQQTPQSPITLECVRQGVSCWTAQLPAGAIPVNADLNEYTGDIEGFQDLTGDGIPDLAVLAEGEAGGTLELMNGLDGTLVWSAPAAAHATVQGIVRAGGADLAVLTTAEGVLGLSLLDGATGEVAWSAAAELTGAISDPRAHLQPVLDAEGEVESLLLTVEETAASGQVAGSAALGHVYSIDPASGATLWSGATVEGAAAPPQLELLSAGTAPRGLAGVPAPGAPLVLVALVGAAIVVLARRARR